MSEYVDFHYMPLEGKITGEQVLKQTEDAINDLGEHVYELDIDESRIDEAIENSEQAINTANSALAAVTTDRAVWKNTVAEMKETDIDLGVTAATRGKMVFNDGNGAFYGVRSEKSGDVESDDTVFLNNGNVAERLKQMNVIAKGNNIIYVTNVAELIASDAVIGNVYGTAGYYTSNDGGNGVYTIRAKNASDNEDGGSIILLDNDNVAELITDGTVNVKQFGAVGDGVTDDTAAFLNAIATNKKVVIPLGTFVLKDTLTLPVGGEIYGLGYGSILKIQHDNVGFLLKDGYRGNHIHDFQVNGGSDGVFAFDIKRPQCLLERIYFESYTGDGINIGNGDSTGGYATWLNSIKFVGNKNAEGTISRKYALYIDVNGGLVVCDKCNFALCSRAVSVYSCAGVFFQNGNVSECNSKLIPTTEDGGIVFYLMGGNTISIKNCYLENMNNLMIMDGAKNVSIDGCYINLLAQSTRGVRILSGNGFAISNSYFTSTYTTFIAIEAVSAYNKMIKISKVIFNVPTILSAPNAFVVQDNIDVTQSGDQKMIDFGNNILRKTKEYLTEIDSSVTTISSAGTYISTGTVNITLTSSSLSRAGSKIDFLVASGTLTITFPRAYGATATVTMTIGQGCRIIKRVNGYYAALTAGNVTT